MRAVLISIRPKWCELIANGKKTVEVRKTRPKLDTPFRCYIYCTKDNTVYVPSKIWWKSDKTGFQHIMNGKVIGEFVCDSICDMRDVEQEPTCITTEEWLKYTDGHKGIVYGWHISDLVIYDKPKKLSEFSKHGFDHPVWLKRPPQSWCYVEERD